METKTKVDMNRVRAFLARKEEQDRQRGLQGHLMGEGSGTVRVTIAGGNPISRTIPDAKTHIHEFTANALHWQVIIYESMGAFLGLELNAAMPPLAIHRAVTQRLQEMDDADRANIPDPIRECIENLYRVINGDGETAPALRNRKVKARTTISPITIKKPAPDVVAVFPVGSNPEKLARIMDANARWNHWRQVHPCVVKEGTKEIKLNGWIVIQCDEFVHWSDKPCPWWTPENGWSKKRIKEEHSPLKQLFASFDKPIEGKLVTPAPPKPSSFYS